MLTTLIILIQLFVHQAHGNNTRVNIEGCKTAVTLGYGYKVTYRIQEVAQHSDNQLMFKFYVKTRSDAHILLSTVDNPTDSDPSYEIVFGGGRNSFSAIRSKGRDLSTAHIETPNILSPEEYRGFWIKLSSLGRIEIGKAESNIPILFWDDSHPISIHYIAFGSWASFVGQWAYSCPNDLQADEMPTKLTSLEKLRSELLTHYDPFTIPVIQTGDVTTVYFQLKSQSIDIDEKHSTMSIIAAVQLQWQDQKLLWDPQQNGNISKLTIMSHEIWLPYLTLYNSAGTSTMMNLLEDRPVNVSPLGSVKWKTQMNAEVHCNLDLSEWPYDRQTCELHLGFWTEEKYLKLLYNTESNKGPQQTNSEWHILNLEHENIHLKTPWMNVSDVPKDAVIVLRYVLQRNNYMYRAVFGVPLLVISIMTLLPFWISPMNPHKLHISCLSLIIMTIFVVSLGHTLPAPAGHIPVLVKTYSQGMVAVAFSIFISVAVITIARSTHIRPVPQIIQTLMNGKYIQLILFFPAMSNKDAADYGNLVEGGSSDHLADCSSNSCNVNNIQEQWALLATIIDRVSFLIYVIYLSAVFLGQLSHM